MTATSPILTNDHLLTRNPIFTFDKKVWGYEIQTAAERVAGLPVLSASSSVGAVVIAGNYAGVNAILARGKKIVIAYTQEQIQSLLPRALPAKSSIVLVGPACQQDSTLAPALEQLSVEGHAIALEWDKATTPGSPLLRHACLYMASPDQLSSTEMLALKQPGKTVIIRNVANPSMLNTLRNFGFELFQGQYFKIAEIIPGKKLSAHQSSRLRLMNLIKDNNPDLHTLTQAIQADVSLSYRLLAYLNSAHFGLARTIESIDQAIVLLGWKNLRNWLRAILMADLTQNEQQAEATYTALTRGKFLEMLVQRYDYWDFSPDEMFLLGIFSLLDVILGQPMHDVLDFLPLTEAQKKSLIGDEACAYTPLINLMRVAEGDNPVALQRTIMELSLDLETITVLTSQASDWASSMLAPLQPAQG